MYSIVLSKGVAEWELDNLFDNSRSYILHWYDRLRGEMQDHFQDSLLEQEDQVANTPLTF